MRKQLAIRYTPDTAHTGSTRARVYIHMYVYAISYVCSTCTYILHSTLHVNSKTKNDYDID